MDEVGEEFWLSLVRGPVDKNADRASRRAPVSLTIVFAHERERERERERGRVFRSSTPIEEGVLVV